MMRPNPAISTSQQLTARKRMRSLGEIVPAGQAVLTLKEKVKSLRRWEKF